jgi:hypothetical protein
VCLSSHDESNAHRSLREELRDALQASHVRVKTEFYPEKGHTDTIAAFSIPARSRLPTLDQATKFMRDVAGSCKATME